MFLRGSLLTSSFYFARAFSSRPVVYILPGQKSNFLLLYYISFHSSSQEVCQIFIQFSNFCSVAGLHNIIIVYYRRMSSFHTCQILKCARPLSSFSSCQILCRSCKRAAKELRLSNFKRAAAAVKF